MPDKVYGICGGNKCRKEVIAAENIFIHEAKFKPQDSEQKLSVELPEGMTSENCVILSAMLYQEQSGFSYPSAMDIGATYSRSDIMRDACPIYSSHIGLSCVRQTDNVSYKHFLSVVLAIDTESLMYTQNRQLTVRVIVMKIK